MICVGSIIQRTPFPFPIRVRWMEPDSPTTWMIAGTDFHNARCCFADQTLADWRMVPKAEVAEMILGPAWPYQGQP